MPPEIVAGLEPRLQELLGYDVHPPFIGYVDGLHPRKLLEKHNLRRPEDAGSERSRL